MLNQWTGMGRLIADPELKKTSNDISTVSFKMAVERDYAPKGEEKQADFINVVAWRNTADFVCKYFKKGQWITVKGPIQTRTYENKEGNKVYVTEIVAEQVYFTGDKKDGNATTQATNTVPSTIVTTDMGDFEEITTADDENLPF